MPAYSDMSPNSPPDRFFALIPAAGQGSRAGGDVPKQYQMIAGQAMVLHTLAAFSAVTRLAQTLVVVAPGDRFFEPMPMLGCCVVHCGGANRADSVANGLQALSLAGAALHDWVLVHDAARCLITAAQINQLIDACEHDDVGGLLAHPLPDTLKREEAGRAAATIDRSDKWLAQTPQMFRIGPLMLALANAGKAVTDESSAMEAMGLTPKLVAGSSQNFKVTYPEDFMLAGAILLIRSNEIANGAKPEPLEFATTSINPV